MVGLSSVWNSPPHNCVLCELSKHYERQMKALFWPRAAFAIKTSVRLSLCHIRESRLNTVHDIEICLTVCTIPQNDVRSLLMPNSTVQNSGVHPQRSALKTGTPCRQRKLDQ